MVTLCQIEGRIAEEVLQKLYRQTIIEIGAPLFQEGDNSHNGASILSAYPATIADTNIDVSLTINTGKFSAIHWQAFRISASRLDSRQAELPSLSPGFLKFISKQRNFSPVSCERQKGM